MKRFVLSTVFLSAVLLLMLWTRPEPKPMRLPKGAHAYVLPESGPSFRGIRETITWAVTTLNGAVLFVATLKGLANRRSRRRRRR